MSLKGKKIAILAEDLYEDLELWYPALRLREAGAEVTVVGPKTGTYASKHGYPARAEAAADEVKASDFDGLIIPGGYSPDRMRRHPAMVELVRQVFRQGKVVGAICHGPWMLASAGVLSGKRATSFYAIRDDVVNAGAIYEDSEVVRDDNLITSRTPEDLPAFLKAIIEALEEA